MFTLGLKQLVSRMRRQPLEFEVAGCLQAFDDLEQFGQFLDLRLEIPAATVKQMAALDGHALTREVRHVSRAYKNAVDIMVRAAETGQSVMRLWRQLDISRVPDDHDWPSILFAIGNADRFPDGFHRVALAHYIRYLDARRNLVDSLQHESRKMESMGNRPVVPASMRGLMGEEPRFTTTRHSVYARLPRRRSITVSFDTQPNLTLYLARNRFLLRQDSGSVQLLGQDGAAYPLHSGRNTIGRSSQCDIRVETSQSDISREHLLIEIDVDGHVSLTDLSSRGTYVAPELLSLKASASSTTESSILH
ncbi:MAG: FHA domain-containing protein [Gammaproteobacteria bacterium]